MSGEEVHGTAYPSCESLFCHGRYDFGSGTSSLPSGHSPTHIKTGQQNSTAELEVGDFGIDLGSIWEVVIWIDLVHWSLLLSQDVPPVEPPGCIPLICPAGTAILMDMRVWHGGTMNRSNTARPMLSVHYAGPNYNEDVLKDGGSIPFFGTCYWSYHRGALDLAALKQLTATGRELCKHLVAENTVSCVNCNAGQLRPGRKALRSIGAPGGPWLCLKCWAAQKSSIMR